MSKKRLVIIIVAFCLIIGSLIGFFYLSSLMEKPLGPSLKNNPTQPISTQALLLPDPESTALPEVPPIPTIAESNATPLPPLCGKDPVLTVLALGIDFRGDNYLYGLADVIRVVRVDFTTHQVSLLTLDRNIWVEIPGISDHYGLTHGLINQAYFFGVPAMGYYDGSGGGAGLLAATLQKNFGLDVDNYVVVDMAVFVRLVNALGGIDIDLPEPVDGTPALPFFNAGKQHLSGQQALDLARIREKYTTLARDKNQTLIIKAIFSRISSPDVLLKIPKLLQAFKNAGLTDLSPRQIEDMVCLLNKMDRTDLVFRDIPNKYYIDGWIYEDYMHQNVNIWKIDFNIFRAYIGYFMKGLWPQ
jgi:LCP family protein required for cell wall assembly